MRVVDRHYCCARRVSKLSVMGDLWTWGGTDYSAPIMAKQVALGSCRDDLRACSLVEKGRGCREFGCMQPLASVLVTFRFTVRYGRKLRAS